VRDPAPWLKKYEWLLGMACLLGLLGQYLFVSHEAGISVPLFVLAFYGVFFYGVQGRIGGFDKWRGQSRSAWLLFLPIALLSLTYVLYNNAVFRLFNPLAILSLMIMQCVLITRSSTQPWYRPAFYTDVLKHAVARPFEQLSVPFELIQGMLKWKDGQNQSGAAIRKILLGLLIAAPLLIVVVILLSSADSIFLSWVNYLPQLLPFTSMNNIVWRFIVAIVLALYSFCFIVGLLFRRPAERSLSSQLGGQSSAAFSELQSSAASKGELTEGKEKGADPLVAGTLFISINLVYVLFAVIQFTYLFGAANGLLPDGNSYSDYARSGFAELVIVALINLGLLLFGLCGIRKAGPASELIRKMMLTLLVGCTLVMLTSAYSRLSLYEEAYGFTQLRLLAHGFMIYLGVLLFIALFAIWYSRVPLAKSVLTWTLAFYVAMNYVNMDARIAENNIARFEQSGEIDIHYLSTLSMDAAPALMRLHSKHLEDLPIAGAVVEMKERAASDSSWQAWSMARMRAR